MSQQRNQNELPDSDLNCMRIRVEYGKRFGESLGGYTAKLTRLEEDELVTETMDFIELLVDSLQAQGCDWNMAAERARDAAYEKLLNRFPEQGLSLGHKACIAVVAARGRVRQDAGSATPIQAQSGGAGSRREMVDAFIARVHAHMGQRITRADIWRLAGHKASRQFEYWQSGHPKATKADARNFARILALSTEKFVAAWVRRTRQS